MPLKLHFSGNNKKKPQKVRAIATFFQKMPLKETQLVAVPRESCFRGLGYLYQEGIGKKWRNHKSTLKKQYFKKDISLKEKLRNVLPGMLKYQWEDAIRFWNSKKEKDCERAGTSSRQKQKFTHIVGSKSFACVAEAMELLSGQKVRLFQLFDITHRKKNRSPMTFKPGEIVEKLKDKKIKYETIASSDSSFNLEDIDNRIITEVLVPERYGRMQASTVEQIAQLRAEAAAREAKQSRKYYKFQLQLQNMMKMFQ
ncbi:hypothetical protein J1N35_021562 [Gossypium stocksii]|uniref:Transposase n=1 Tax=Gossypium stocksii TaxID=47602 RepID=A0A9D4A0B0_9ROSI|nr:hypothetical protein J1N35_021562 [Gossypium stocksii]